MQVTVVTPYYREPDAYLRQAHDSVRAQAHPCRHVLVADGFPNPIVDGWAADHVVLAAPSGDDGNTPRAAGAEHAIAAGVEAIAFLDADNWFLPDHIASLVQLHRQTGAAICTSGRSLNAIDGSVLIAHDPHSDGELFVDANCYLITRAAFHLLPFWRRLPKALSPLNDVVFWMSVCAGGVSTAHSARPTVGYRTGYPHHYLNLGLRAPPEATAEREARVNRGKIHWCHMTAAEKLTAVFGYHATDADRAGTAREPDRFYLNERVARVETTQIRDPLFDLGTRILREAERPDRADLEPAERVLRAVAASFPDHAGAANNLALLLDKTGRTAEALGHVRHAIALEPDLAMLWSNAGNMLARLGRRDEAEAHFRRALELKPDEERYKMKIATLIERREPD